MSRGGSKPGERRGGRKAGTPNKLTKDTRSRFRAMAELVEPKLQELGEQGNIAAIREIMDRAYGKAPQPLSDVNADGPLVIKLIKYDGS